MSVNAVIFGLSGPKLTAAETAFFRDVNPWGFILFSRNIETPEQVKALTTDLRNAVGRDCFVFVDQEGGRVQRFKPPHWRKITGAWKFGEIFSHAPDVALRACWLNFRLMAHELSELGVDADCTPVLDLPVAGADPIISDRAFCAEADCLISLAHAAMSGLMAGGVAPVIKHIPGHGRADVDSHLALPKITTDIDTLRATDFTPFKALSQAPMAMTAHVVMAAIDPARTITLSPKAIDTIIRKEIGYDGLVMTDDLDMKALNGSLTHLAQAALAAGNDIVLQCSGKLPAMVNVAKGLSALSGKAQERAEIAQMCREMSGVDIDPKQIIHEYNDIMTHYSDPEFIRQYRQGRKSVHKGLLS